MKPIYDQIGANLSAIQRTDPRMAERLLSELQGARRVINIGAGTESYEPPDPESVELEPSSKMIAQRRKGLTL